MVGFTDVVDGYTENLPDEERTGCTPAPSMDDTPSLTLGCASVGGGSSPSSESAALCGSAAGSGSEGTGGLMGEVEAEEHGDWEAPFCR